MAPIAMPCEAKGCRYATEEDEPAVAIEFLKQHRLLTHVYGHLIRPTAPFIRPTQPTEVAKDTSTTEVLISPLDTVHGVSNDVHDLVQAHKIDRALVQASG